VRIADFGLSRKLDTFYDMTGAIGCLPFMAPEGSHLIPFHFILCFLPSYLLNSIRFFFFFFFFFFPLLCLLVFKFKPYGTPADVFSFGMCLFVIWSGREPNRGMKAEEYAELVASSGYRPRLKSIPSFWLELMTDCWQERPELRPSFETIQDRLKKHVSGESILRFSFLSYSHCRFSNPSHLSSLQILRLSTGLQDRVPLRQH
jgi:serine/threonine protein kinase